VFLQGAHRGMGLVNADFVLLRRIVDDASALFSLWVIQAAAVISPAACRPLLLRSQ
jgi:hypothetical protein